jgi:hypothetical protein
MSRITNRLGWGIAGALGVALLATLGGVIYAGPLAPPAAPSATGPTQIFSLPYTISTRGSYVVSSDLVCWSCTAGQAGITINAGDTTLDLGGFRVAGVAGSGDGIRIPVATANIEIRNGTVIGWTGWGIDMAVSPNYVSNSRLEDLRVSNNLYGGALIGGTTSVTRSEFLANHCVGIQAGDIGGSGNIIADNKIAGTVFCSSGSAAILFEHEGNQIRNNAVSYNKTIGVYAAGNTSTITGNTISNNDTIGIRIIGNANNVENNSVTGNDMITGGYDGILVTGAKNRIDSNHVEANGGFHAINIISSTNTITRNTGSGASTSAFAFAAGNTAGPTQTQATPLGNPWANIAY